jgi:UDP-N-acetylmuramoyl-L-alanyl-D-glutamate--2,6-diaminopimelate ligase
MSVLHVERGLPGRDAVAEPRRPLVPDGPYLVMGVGNAGRSAAARLAARDGSSAVLVCDDGSGDEVRRARRDLAGTAIEFTDDPIAALDRVGAVVKSPGIKLSHPVITAARARRLPVLDEFELGWRLSRQPVVAITGTDGKSTTCGLVVAALEAAGGNPLLGGNVEGFRRAPAMSSIPPEHDGWVVAEVSSYQAAGSAEFLPSAAVLTNLAEAHLGWHGSMEAYAAAKRRLFVHGDRGVSLGVLNADDEFGRRLARDVQQRGGRAITFGFGPEAEYRIRSSESSLRGAWIELEAPGGSVQMETRLPGAYNAANVAAALALSDGLGLARDGAIGALASSPPLPGRFTPVDEGQAFDVVVDFAHTPAAVEQALGLARELTSRRGGRVIALMGKVGPGTRPYQEGIGRACSAGADHLVICGSSLRGEPQLIEVPGVLAGARQVSGGQVDVVLDRRKAIGHALSIARPGDLVVIMGRGGRRRMMYDRKGPPGRFDDREVTRELLRELLS